jgi:hypothetical protein
VACLDREAETMNRHAQLTMMILMGLILLITISVVIWIGTSTMTKSTETGAEEQRLRQVAVQPVRDYIQSCLDVTILSGLELVGKQGGVIYKAQGGLTQDIMPGEEEGARYIKYDGLNLSYLIRRPNQNVGMLYFSEPPYYPWPTFPYVINKSDNSIVRVSYSGYFGKSLLPPLFKPGKDSIQEQLESYISYNLPRCTDWKKFNITHGLSIVAGKPNITVMIAENRTQIASEQYFSVLAEWQVSVTDLTTGGNTVLDEFSIGYPVQLAKFYVFMQNLIYSEINDSRFDPQSLSTPQNPVYFVDDAFTNPNDNGKDDIFIVQDAQSQLRGKPLEFRILRQNRYPALEWINQTGLKNFTFFTMGLCKDVESIFLKGNELSITYATDSPYEFRANISAVDPDEDNVTFRIDPSKIGRYQQPESIDASHIYRLYVYASDGGNTEDFQVLNLTVDGCPRE